MTNSNNMPADTHNDLTAQYGCTASMTVVTFVAHNVVHRARRFFREDLPESGKVEIYTIASYPGAEYTMSTELGWYASTTNEDWMRYADKRNPSAVDAVALERIAAAQSATFVSTMGADQSERFALIELA